jgi:hypothetical protein
VWSIAFGLPLAFLLMYLYLWRWGADLNINSERPAEFLYFILILVAILVMGSIIHELIHGFTWAYFGHKPFNAIKFGFQWKTLTPYAHCREPMEVQAYRLGGVMPLLALGILPALIGIGTGNGWFMFFGFLFTIGAGGDMLVLWLIRGVKSGQLVEDHPTQAGCYLIETHTTR